jgi:2-polyprenyl-3-methyl-5-hydroxy-6-metoxy-1,4-benzoquinol methylase
MNRKKIILSHINISGQGLEIGPSHSPVAPKKDGYRVHVIDHMNSNQLREKYKGHQVELSNIEDVDFVWNGESYADLTGKRKFYSWIIASHVIEHTPDLITFLINCDEVLKDDGAISLAIPDKRYCFDHYRPPTGLGRIIDAYLEKNSMHSAGTVAEYFLNVVSRAGRIGWEPYSRGKYSLVHTLEEARNGVDRVITKKEYIDVHAWCFTPHSFRLIVHDLYCLGLIPFREAAFSAPAGSEFYITLSRAGQGMKPDRLAVLEATDAELAAAHRITGVSGNMLLRRMRKLAQGIRKKFTP